MSWDIFVQDIPASAKSTADLPSDFVPKPIGRRDDLVEKIRARFPSADFTDPAWGKIDGPDYSIEVNLGSAPLTEGFAFHIRGGEMAVFVVADLLSHLGLRAFDPSSETGIFESDTSSLAGFRRWREYRDQVIRQAP